MASFCSVDQSPCRLYVRASGYHPATKLARPDFLPSPKCGSSSFFSCERAAHHHHSSTRLHPLTITTLTYHSQTTKRPSHLSATARSAWKPSSSNLAPSLDVVPYLSAQAQILVVFLAGGAAARKTTNVIKRGRGAWQVFWTASRLWLDDEQGLRLDLAGRG